MLEQKDMRLVTGQAVKVQMYVVDRTTLPQLSNVVIDEHGGTSGVVTLEDLFEEVVGEIDDSPERRSGPRRDSSGRLRVPGTMRLDELGQLFDLELTHEDVDSVSGLILTLLGRPPRVGDSIEYDRLRLDVTATKGRGVDEAAVTLHGSGDGAED